MSFDLKIQNGDLVLSSSGDLAIVENTDKLVQDVLKILMTKIGANTFFPWYGSPFSSSSIGNPADAKFLQSISDSQIRSALETLQSLQREQSLSQDLTASETLAAVRSVAVVRNQMDPTSYVVKISILTKSLKTIDTSFSVDL